MNDQEIKTSALSKWLVTHFEIIFVSGFKFVWGNFLEFWSNILNQTWEFWTKTLDKAVDPAWDSLASAMEGGEFMSKEQADNFRNLKQLAPTMSAFLFLGVSSRLLGSYLATITSTGSKNLQQKYNKEMRSDLPNYTDVIRAAFVAPEKTERVREIMARLGLTEEDIDLIFLSMYRLYPEEQIRALYLRGVLDENKMYERMRELGYTDTRIKEIVQGWPIIPGVQDLFYLVGKEAFEPESIEQLGLAAEFPEDQVQWLEKQGLSREWGLKYWYAHWDQPSLQMGFEMLHRGVIDEELLDVLFKTVEMPPFWRDKLTKIAYSPYSRVDARRMHKVGVLKDADLMRVYKDIGYDDEHAQNMADFTVKYNTTVDKKLTKSNILTGYTRKAITAIDTKGFLIDIGYTNDQALYFIGLEDYKDAQKEQDEFIDDIEDRYKNRLYTKAQTITKLDALGIPASQRNLLMDRWSIKLVKDRKVPARADLAKFLRNGIINEDEYKLEMDRLGYGVTYTNWYYQLAKIPKAK